MSDLELHDGMELICIDSDTAELPSCTIFTVDSSAVPNLITITALGYRGIFSFLEPASTDGMLKGIVLRATPLMVATITARKLSDYSDVDIFKIKLSGRFP